jgi:hypothetical protein
VTSFARTVPLLLTFLLSAIAAAQPAEKEPASLRERAETLDQFLRQSPARFVEESLALADEYERLAKRTPNAKPSPGDQGTVVTILQRAASATRYQLGKPAQAIDLYRRAGALQEQQYRPSGGLVFGEDIADIQQFDLGDRAAAAATLRRLRDLYKPLAGSKDELTVWYVWKAKWIDAEIAWLESGKPYTGNIDAAAMTGFIPQIYFGAGAGAVGGVLLDPTLNIYDSDAVPAAELEKKLSALRPSHSTFLQTWMFAARLPTPAAVQKWLTRNDPGGYWTASLLILAAVAERDLDPSEDPRFNVVASLIRTESNQPTAIALLARQYAKNHRLPPPMKLNIGH